MWTNTARPSTRPTPPPPIELLHTATWSTTTWWTSRCAGVFSIKPCGRRKWPCWWATTCSAGACLRPWTPRPTTCSITSRAVREMSEGELLQIEKARRLDITEEVYFDIIRRKTASLCRLLRVWRGCVRGGPRDGGPHVGARGACGFGLPNPRRPARPRRRRPDGKPTGQDIRERKMTLPLIHTLAKATPKRATAVDPAGQAPQRRPQGRTRSHGSHPARPWHGPGPRRNAGSRKSPSRCSRNWAAPTPCPKRPVPPCATSSSTPYAA